MYNFSIPNFKAYIDQVVRVGRTFMEENGQVKGLANGKKFCSSHREALSLEQGLTKDGIVRNLPGMLFNTWV